MVEKKKLNIQKKQQQKTPFMEKVPLVWKQVGLQSPYAIPTFIWGQVALC
jgi:hypothetical protein